MTKNRIYELKRVVDEAYENANDGKMEQDAFYMNSVMGSSNVFNVFVNAMHSFDDIVKSLISDKINYELEGCLGDNIDIYEFFEDVDVTNVAIYQNQKDLLIANYILTKDNFNDKMEYIMDEYRYSSFDNLIDYFIHDEISENINNLISDALYDNNLNSDLKLYDFENLKDLLSTLKNKYDIEINDDIFKTIDDHIENEDEDSYTM